MKRFVALLAACLLGQGSVSAQPAPPTAPIPPAALEGFVDGAVRQAMETEHVAGVAVIVVQGDRVVLQKGYGLAALEPVRAVDPAATRFRIGSVSKTFTWLMLLKLAEAGKLDLNAPINRYLPKELQVAPQGFTQPIRVLDLMAHAPGFDDPSFGILLVRNPKLLPNRRTALAAHQPRRVRGPGQFGTYSNHGTSLAGIIVEQVTGLGFEEAAEALLFTPMGMARTSFREPYPPRSGLPRPLPAAVEAEFAQGLAWTGGAYRAKPFEYLSHRAPAGSASTTADDMGRYLRTQLRDGVLDGNAVWGPATARAIRTPILKANPGSNGWAHGFMQLDMPGGVKGYAHGGATQDQTAYMMVIPAHDLGIFVATNSGAGFALAERMPRLLLERFYAPPGQLRAPVPALDAEADRFAGTYLSTRRPYFGLEAFLMRPQVEAEVSVGGGYLRTIAGGQARAWVPDGAPGRFRDARGDEILQFNLGPDGRAVSFDTRQGTSRMERQPAWASTGLLYSVTAAGAVAALWLLVSRARRLWRLQKAAPTLRRIDLFALLTGSAWLTALILFGVWILTLDGDSLLVTFPTPLLLASSATALIAVACTAGLAAFVPAHWQNRPHWSRLQAGLLTLSVMLLTLLSISLWLRGFLTPWA